MPDPAQAAAPFADIGALARALDRAAEPVLRKHPLLGSGIRLKTLFANIVLASLKRAWFARPETAAPRRIVAYTVGTLGDNVVMAPALAALRHAWPEAHLTLVNNVQSWSREIAEDFLRGLPGHDRLVCMTGLDCPVQRRGLCFVIPDAGLAEIRADLFVNLSPFGNRGWPGAVFREMIWARRMGATWAVGFRVAPSIPSGPFTTLQHRFVVNEPRRHLDILAELAIPPPKERRLPGNAAAATSAARLVGALGLAPGSFGLLHPGAKFKSQQWPPDSFASVAARVLAQTGLRSVVTGTAAEASLCERVAAASGGATISLAGRTTAWELVELARMSRFCVTNDTGTMHVAAAVDTPTVAVFSAYQNPYRWFPDAPRVRVFWTPAACAGCGRETCDAPGCLTAVRADDVAAACLGLVREEDAAP